MKWAWGAMSLGIKKFAPRGYSVRVVDQSEFRRLHRAEDHFLERMDGVCHFSWTESPLPCAAHPLPIRRLTTLAASHGFEFPYPAVDSNDIPTTISTALRNVHQAKRALPEFDAVLCVSQRILISAKDFTPHAVRVVPGVDHQHFKRWPLPGGERLRIGWCAQKPEVRNNTKGYREVLVPLMDKLGESVKWIINDRSAQNPLDRQQMAEWFRDIDVILSTSCSEGFQMPLLEAAACGRPIIATDVGGANELVTNDRNGFIMPAWKTVQEAAVVVDALADKIRWCGSNREKLSDMGRESRKIVEDDFTWEKRVPEWLAVIGGPREW